MKRIFINEHYGTAGNCRLKYGLVFVDFRNKNLNAYKFDEKDFVSNIVRFDIVVGIIPKQTDDNKYAVEDATTKFACARI